MAFSDVFGLDPAVAVLRRALSGGQLAGSYLFVGPPSVGKTTLALALARAAACLSPRSDPFDACGECHSCRLSAAGSHPEIALISPAGDQTQIWQFWDRDGKPAGALSHSLSFAPTAGAKRVYIVERADTLNEAAANSLLKVLEEPPPYALFVLLTPHVARMLPTVISRCQLVRLSPAPLTALSGLLQSRTGVTKERADACAALSEGRTGMALRLASDAGAADEIGKALDLTLALATAEPLSALGLGEGLRKLASSFRSLGQDESAKAAPAEAEEGQHASRERAGRKQIGLTIDLVAAGYRDLLAISVGGESAPIVNAERRLDLSRAAASGRPERWIAGLNDLLSARRRLDQNVSIPILTDWLAMRLVHAQ
jgi:DNA polymerase-3 subunit delta'